MSLKTHRKVVHGTDGSIRSLNCVPGAYDEHSKGVWEQALFPVSQREGARLVDLRPIASQLVHSSALPEATRRA